MFKVTVHFVKTLLSCIPVLVDKNDEPKFLIGNTWENKLLHYLSSWCKI